MRYTNKLAGTKDRSGQVVGADMATTCCGGVWANHYYYLDSSGTKQTITINYSSFTVQSNFGLPSMTDFSPHTQSLPISIVYPDGSSYSFTYEPTPGHSGSVTARLASVTIPTGGVIRYTYPSTNDGMFSDYTLSGLTRTTTDGAINIQRTKPTLNTSTASVIYPSGNTESYSFNGGGTSAAYFLTGSSLHGESTSISYQPIPTSCVYYCSLQQVITDTLDNGLFKKTTNSYNSYGELTERDETDFVSSGTPPLLRKTLLTYATSFINIFDRVTQAVVEDASANILSQTKYYYDETTAIATSGLPNHTVPSVPPGNLTRVSRWNSSDPTHWIDTSYTVDDSGQVRSVSGPTPGQTTFAYDSTDTFVIQETAPTVGSISLSTHATYDIQTGLMTSSTDANSHKTIYTYDSLLRPSTVTRDTTTGGDGGVTTYTHPSTTQTNVASTIGNGYSTNEESFLDSYGRVSRSATASGLTSTPWFLSDACYDSDGRRVFSSLPFAASNTSVAKVCSGTGDAFAFDTHSRLASVTHADGSQLQYSYLGRAAKTTDEGAGSAHNTRIVQTDGLGRLALVCEYSVGTGMTGSPAAGSCGTDINVSGGDPSATGYLSQYTHNLAARTVTVSQSGAVRSWQSDSLGRTIMEQVPERQGSTTFSYAFNSTGLQVSRTRVAPNQLWGIASPSYVTTTTQMDAIGRPISTSYSDGITPTTTVAYDVGGTTPATHNMLGNLASASVGSNSILFSYTSNGQIEWQQTCLASTCGGGSPTSIIQSYGYDLLGQTTSASDGATDSVAYQYNSVAQLSAVTAMPTGGSYANVRSNIAYGPFGVSSFTDSSSIAGLVTYDSRGRNNGLQVNNSSAAIYNYSLIWAGNGSLTHSQDSQNDTWTYGYDEFNRLIAASKDSGVQGFAYQYDVWGNLNGQTVTAGSGPTITHSFDSAHSNHVTAYSYDAAGNVLSDGFHTYTYDPEGRILSVDGTTTYSYGPGGYRVEVQKSTGTTNYVYTQEGQLSTVWSGTTLVKENIYMNGAKIAHDSPASGRQFEYADWMGSARVVTDGSGSVTQSFTSIPFNGPTGAASDQAQMSSLDWDAESQSGHAWARQYSPRSAAWLSPDPSNGSYDFTNPQSLNRYNYVGNDPMSYSDPSGLARFEGGTEGFGTDDSDSTYSGQEPNAGYNRNPCFDPNGCTRLTVWRLLGSFLSSLASQGGGADDGNGVIGSYAMRRLSSYQGLRNTAQQTYGRQPDGSYKADPADVQAAIKAGKPILEPGNPDHKSECVFACKALSQMKNIGTSQWRKGKAATGLNDTTDIGLAIATLGSGTYPSQHGNSGIYMGHDANGGIKIVDQWPNNGPDYNHPFEHTLTRHDQGPAMDPNAYFVIIVPKP